jgi:DNA-binding CsgD family transcriptional regulator
MKPRNAIAAFQALCGLGLGAQALLPAALEALHSVLPSCCNRFDWAEERGHRLRSGTQVASATPFSASDPAAGSGLAAALGAQLQRPLRGRDGRLLGTLVLLRAAGKPRFSLNDERHLAAVLPALAEGLQAGEAAPADDCRVPSPEPAQTLLLTLQGEVCHASRSGPLDALADDLLPGLLVHLREQVAQAQAPITHTVERGPYRAQAVLLQPRLAQAEPLAQVTLRRLEPHRVALERALRALPVTAGQMAVCRQLYGGQSHNEIGAHLGVAPATVVDHVRKLYRALDVRSTAALRAHLDGLMRWA